MAETSNPDQVRDYLLGRLTGPERDSIAARILEDEDVFAVAREVEDDLLDALARGDLSDAEAAEVRRFVEDSGQSQRLVMARALAQSARRGATIRGPVFVRSFLAIAATLLICLVGAFFYYQNERLARQQSAAEAPTRQPVVFAFSVPPGTTRGAGAATGVKIPAGTELVRIHIELDPGYEHYSVSLRNTAGKEIQRVQAGELEIPAQFLPRGRYEIAVTANKPGAAAEPLNFHYFEIESSPTR